MLAFGVSESEMLLDWRTILRTYEPWNQPLGTASAISRVEAATWRAMAMDAQREVFGVWLEM